MRKLLTVLTLTGCGYNTFQTTDEQVKASGSEVINQYQRCADLETAFQQSNYEGGVISGVQAVTQHLVRHFPADDRGNELPDRPVIL